MRDEFVGLQVDINRPFDEIPEVDLPPSPEAVHPNCAPQRDEGWRAVNPGDRLAEISDQGCPPPYHRVGRSRYGLLEGGVVLLHSIAPRNLGEGDAGPDRQPNPTRILQLLEFPDSLDVDYMRRRHQPLLHESEEPDPPSHHFCLLAVTLEEPHGLLQVVRVMVRELGEREIGGPETHEVTLKGVSTPEYLSIALVKRSGRCSFMALQTVSGFIGRLFSLIPVASRMAFEIAEATDIILSSPIPLAPIGPSNWGVSTKAATNSLGISFILAM